MITSITAAPHQKVPILRLIHQDLKTPHFERHTHRIVTVTIMHQIREWVSASYRSLVKIHFLKNKY